MSTESPKQSPQGLYEQAIAAMSAGRTSEALAALKSIREAGLTSAGIERALGQAYAKSGNFGLAVEHMSLSVALDRKSMSARKDLEWIQSQVEAGLGTRMNHPVEWGYRLSTYVRWDELLFLGGALFLVAGAFRYFRPERRTAFWTAAVISILMLGAAALAFSSRSITTLREKAPLLESPLASGTKTLDLPAGARARVLRTSGDFSEIERPSGFRGWVEARKLSSNPF